MDDLTRRCPLCAASVPDGESECGGCGTSIYRLCNCGKTVTIFMGECPDCGTVVLRETTREYGGFGDRYVITPVLRALGGAADLASAPLRALGGLLHRPHRGEGRAARCHACDATIRVRSDACTECGAGFLVPCGCGSDYHRYLDPECPACARPTCGRKPLRLRWVGLVLLLGIGVAAAVYVRPWRFVREESPSTFADARLAYDQGDFARAVRLFDTQVKAHPDHPLSRFLLGEALWRSGDRAGGIREVTRAHELDPGMDGPLVFLGSRAFEAGDPVRALRLLRSAVEEAPEPPEAWLLIGRIMAEDGATGPAIDALHRVLRSDLHPPPVDGALLLADLLSERARLLGRRRDALRGQKTYRQVLDWLKPLEGESAEPATNAALARAYRGLGGERIRQALYCAYRAALTGSPELKAEMLVLQARAYWQQDSSSSSDELLEEALEADPMPRTWLRCARFLRERDDGDRALELLSAGLEKFPESLSLLVAWMKEACHRGRFSDAVTVGRRLVDRPDLTARFYQVYAAALALSGDVEGALTLLEGAVAASPDDPRLGIALLGARIDVLAARGGDPREFLALRSELSTWLSQYPDDPGALACLGKLELQRGRWPLAVEALRESISGNPADADAVVHLAYALQAGGAPEEAATLLRRLFAETRAVPLRARVALAQCRFELRRFERCGETLDEVLGLSPRHAGALRMRAEVHLALGEEEAAVAVLTTGLEDHPDSPGLLLLSGLAALIGQDEPGAEAAFAKALNSVPDPVVKIDARRVIEQCRREALSPERAVLTLDRFLAGLSREATLEVLQEVRRARRKELAERRAALSANPSSLTAARRLVAVLLEDPSGLAEARSVMDSAAEHVPGDPLLTCLRAQILTVAGDPAAALVLLNDYQARAPEDGAGRLALGEALYRLNRQDEALSHFRAASRLSPDDPRPAVGLAACGHALVARAFQNGTAASARESLTKVLGYYPINPPAGLSLLFPLQELGSLSGSATDFARWLDAHPDDPVGFRLLGLARLRLGDAVRAETLFRRGAQLSAGGALDRYLLGAALLRGEQLDAAVELGSELSAGDEPRDPALRLEVLAYALLSVGRGNEALALVDRALSTTPGNADLAMLAAVLEDRLGNHQDAGSAYAAVLSADPTLTRALWNLLNLQLALPGGATEAAFALSLRYEAAADDVTLNSAFGWLHVRQERFRAGVPYLLKTLQLNPRQRDGALLLALAEVNAENPDNALAPLVAQLELWPRDTGLMLALARAARAAGQTGEAISACRRALLADPALAPAMNQLALLLLDADEGLVEARRLMEEALSIEPGSPIYLDTLGRVLMVQQDYRGAVRAFSAAQIGFSHLRGDLGRDTDSSLDRLTGGSGSQNEAASIARLAKDSVRALSLARRKLEEGD